MARKFYLDTSIWRDYFEDRRDNIRPLGEFAFDFLKNCEKKKCIVLFSNLIISELEGYYSNEKINHVFSSFKKIIKKVSISDEQKLEAEKISLIIKESHLKDTLHAILAKDNNAVMITRDKHFDSLSFVEVAKPEDVIFD